MTFMWVGHPGQQPPQSQKLSESIAIQQKIFDEIESMGDRSACRICGSAEKLTKEHLPSRSVFNKAKLITFSVMEPLLTRFLHWKPSLAQGGSQDETLCKRCNNNTGSWYNLDYLKFARACSRFALGNKSGDTADIDVNIYPGRLIKQALSYLLSTCQPGLGLKYPNLRELVKNKDKTSDIAPLRIGLFTRVNKGGRHSGITIFVDIKKETARLIAEFSFWPLGWVLTFDNEPFNGTFDITNWVNVETKRKINIKMKIPCQWCVSPYPGDFRKPDEVFR